MSDSAQRLHHLFKQRFSLEKRPDHDTLAVGARYNPRSVTTQIGRGLAEQYKCRLIELLSYVHIHGSELMSTKCSISVKDVWTWLKLLRVDWIFQKWPTKD